VSYTVRFAPAARDQLDAIEDYIALASGLPTTAARFVDGIVAYCESFDTFPERGTRRDDLLPGLRVTSYRKSTTVAFRVDTSARTVAIIGVFYGGQDYEAASDALGP
jgi:plasmid stabilization system protein ParE